MIMYSKMREKAKNIKNKADAYFLLNTADILEFGYVDENPRPKYSDGVPAHTLSVNQVMRRYNLSKGEYPIMTLRPQAWKSAVKEIFWIFSDQSNDLSLLRDKYGVKYWDEWDIGDGTIGKRYGATVKSHIDIDRFIESLKSDPFGRRHIIDLWQESDFAETTGLNPCAFLTMWNVRKTDGKYYIDMTLIQRSGDMCAASGAGGINEIQYTAFMLMMCKATGYLPGVFCHFVQNEQIYDRHTENAILMTERESLSDSPRLILNTDKTDFHSFTIDDFSMESYPQNEIKEKNPQLKFDLGI